MLKVNDTIEFIAKDYCDEGTTGEYEGYRIFVSDAIVGEKALVKINHVKRNVAYGNVIKILIPSEKRVKPQCSLYGKCGGCSLMHLDYSEQLVFKRNKVERNLRKIGNIFADVLPCVASPKVVGYRNKLSLPVSGKKGNVKIGMYRRSSHVVVDVDDCLLGGEWSQKLVRIFRVYFNNAGVQPYDEKTFKGEVRHIVARYVDGQLLATIVSNGKFCHDVKPLVDALKRNFEKFGLFVNENTYKNNVILGKKFEKLYGNDYIEGEHFGVKFRLRPGSFFQVNDGVKDLIYAKAKQLLDVSQTEVLVDCFSGIGILSNALCSDDYDTFAVEIEPSAVRDADEMAQLNNASRLANVLGDVCKELPQIALRNKGKRMSLVVDPPRKGLGADICSTICNSRFDNIVYISCDSATLARDLAFLSDYYEIKYVQPYDMFPNTDQVETVVCITRRQ